MTVYVAKQSRPYYRYKMSLMMADTLQELMDMISVIDLDPKWMKEHQGIPFYWITKGRKQKAIQAGADEVNERWILEKMQSMFR